MSARTYKTLFGGALSIGLVAAPFGALPAGAAPSNGVPSAVVAPAAAGPEDDIAVSIASFNDFHGEISSGYPATLFAGAVEEWRADRGVASTLLTSAGDSIGGSKFASMIQQDEPTLEILNAMGVDVSTAGNHEFDKGWADLGGRVSDLADFPYLAANVLDASGSPVLPAAQTFDVNGVKVAVVGAITGDLPTLVSPGGIAGLTITDPVAAVNEAVAGLPTDVDVVVASYHEGGQTAGTPAEPTDQPDTNLADALAASGIFKRIVTETSPDVDAIFNGHSHFEYNFEAPNGGGLRPVMQAGSSASHLAVADFLVDPDTRDVTFVSSEALPVDDSADPAALAAAFPVVAEVKALEERAVAEAAVLGAEKVGEITESITTDYAPDKVGSAGGDRGKESCLNNLLAESLRSELESIAGEEVQIGVMNAGGVRDELFFTKTGRSATTDDKTAAGTEGDVSFQELANIFPFGNTLASVDLTGAQVWRLLEQQWRLANGVETKLALGLTENLTYTFDTSRAIGDRVTGVQFAGEPIDLGATYSVATLSFLAQGGDGFSAFVDGSKKVDTGFSDLEALVNYVEASSPLNADFARRGVEIVGAPARVEAGKTYSFEVRAIDLGSDGAPTTTEVYLDYARTAKNQRTWETFPVVDGGATVEFTAPRQLRGGTLYVGSEASGTEATVPSELANTKPGKGKPAKGKPSKPGKAVAQTASGR